MDPGSDEPEGPSAGEQTTPAPGCVPCAGLRMSVSTAQLPPGCAAALRGAGAALQLPPGWAPALRGAVQRGTTTVRTQTVLLFQRSRGFCAAQVEAHKRWRRMREERRERAAERLLAELRAQAGTTAGTAGATTDPPSPSAASAASRAQPSDLQGPLASGLATSRILRAARTATALSASGISGGSLPPLPRNSATGGGGARSRGVSGAGGTRASYCSDASSPAAAADQPQGTGLRQRPNAGASAALRRSGGSVASGKGRDEHYTPGPLQSAQWQRQWQRRQMDQELLLQPTALRSAGADGAAGDAAATPDAAGGVPGPDGGAAGSPMPQRGGTPRRQLGREELPLSKLAAAAAAPRHTRHGALSAERSRELEALWLQHVKVLRASGAVKAQPAQPRVGRRPQQPLIGQQQQQQQQQGPGQQQQQHLQGEYHPEEEEQSRGPDQGSPDEQQDSSSSPARLPPFRDWRRFEGRGLGVSGGEQDGAIEAPALGSGAGSQAGIHMDEVRLGMAAEASGVPSSGAYLEEEDEEDEEGPQQQLLATECSSSSWRPPRRPRQRWQPQPVSTPQPLRGPSPGAVDSSDSSVVAPLPLPLVGDRASAAASSCGVVAPLPLPLVGDRTSANAAPSSCGSDSLGASVAGAVVTSSSGNGGVGGAASVARRLRLDASPQQAAAAAAGASWRQQLASTAMPSLPPLQEQQPQEWQAENHPGDVGMGGARPTTAWPSMGMGMGDTLCLMGSCPPVSEEPSSLINSESHQQAKEQLLRAAGVTGSLTASQQALASRLAALQLAVKHQRLQAAAALAAVAEPGESYHGGISSRSSGGVGGVLPGAVGGGEEACWPTCSDICLYETINAPAEALQ